MCYVIASNGLALANAFVIKRNDNIEAETIVSDTEQEINKFNRAVEECQYELERLLSEFSEDTYNDIINFQIMLLGDEYFYGKIIAKITTKKYNAEYSLSVVSEQYIEFLNSLKDNPYLKERASDIRDVTNRLRCKLKGEKEVERLNIPYIVVAEELEPSWVIAADLTYLKGIVLENGGINSHCSIIARDRGIPCLINVTGATHSINNEDIVFLDAENGRIHIKPDEIEMKQFELKIAGADAERAELMKYADKDAVTSDGIRMKVLCNITSENDISVLKEQGADGIGLMRTEMFFSEQTQYPDEEKQYEYYSKIAKKMGERSVIIRTLDVGGDKPIKYLPEITAEDNPFLGYRAIRYCMNHPKMFKSQISAIMRAGANVRIMFPMVTKVSEIVKLRDIVMEVEQELSAKNVAHNRNIKLGIMIETPAAAFDADELAKYVDFFSIGTNDLLQYLYAADRTNALVSELNSPYQSAFIKTVYKVALAAKNAGIPVDICGSAGGVTQLIPLWIAMGIDALSVSPSMILKTKRIICNLNGKECKELLLEILKMWNEKDIERRLNIFEK